MGKDLSLTNDIIDFMTKPKLLSIVTTLLPVPPKLFLCQRSKISKICPAMAQSFAESLRITRLKALRLR